MEARTANTKNQQVQFKTTANIKQGSNYLESIQVTLHKPTWRDHNDRLA